MNAAWDALACSVRGCGRPLERGDRRLACPAGHAFDVARSGYVNLLQPHDRRSLAAGDAKATVAARARLRERGVGAAVDAAIADLLAERALAAGACAVDLGCGTGHHLAGVASRFDVATLGFDLSAEAVDAAARRFPDGAWCVANCDRVLPLRDASVDVVLSVDGRLPPGEVERVLRPDGALVAAVPGPGDLRELRAATLADARDLPGLARVTAFCADRFELVARRETAERARLDAAGLADLSLATYRHARRSEDERLQALDALEVTIAHEIGLFVRARR